LLAVAVESHADFLLESVAGVSNGFFVGLPVQAHNGRVKIEAHFGTEGVDDGLWVLVPGQGFWNASLSHKGVGFYCVESVVVARDEEFACMGCVGEPDLASCDEPIWAVFLE
jgi:hypothetical protein